MREEEGRSLTAGADGGATGPSWRDQSYGSRGAAGRGTGRGSAPRPGGPHLLLTEAGRESRGRVLSRKVARPALHIESVSLEE